MHFEVLFFGSDPLDGNDDLWTGFDFPTLEEAQAFFQNPTFPQLSPTEIVHTIALAKVTNGGSEAISTEVAKRLNPGFKPDNGDDFEGMCKSEARMQGAMAFGVQGWNDWEETHGGEDDRGYEFDDSCESPEF